MGGDEQITIRASRPSMPQETALEGLQPLGLVGEALPVAGVDAPDQEDSDQGGQDDAVGDQGTLAPAPTAVSSRGTTRSLKSVAVLRRLATMR
jgi:hypothetical protein